MGIAALLGLLIVVGVPILSIVSFVRSRDIASRTQRLEKEVVRLKREVSELRPGSGSRPEVDVASDPVPSKASKEGEEKADVGTPYAKATPKEPRRAEVPLRQSQPKVRDAEAVEERAPATVVATGNSWFPETLGAANWLIIGGGVALALAAGFLVKYSVEEGWLGPIARVVIGGLVGIGLLVAGDIARRKSLGRGEAILKFDAMPATLTGAGIIALFASVYGAYALYGLLTPLITFVLLVVISMAAVVLSFSHGIVIAGLGMFGAYVVPLLVQSVDTSATTLFGYLFIVTCGVVMIGRFRWWTWASVGGLIASCLWCLFYVAEAGLGADKDVLMFFWFGLFYLFAVVPQVEFSDDGVLEDKSLAGPINLLSTIACAIGALVVFCVFFADDRTIVSSVLLATLIVSCVILAWSNDRKLPQLFIGCGAALLTLFTWDFILIGVDFAAPLDEYDLGGPRFPAGTESLAWVAAAIALLFTGSGILRAVRLKPLSGLWSAVGVGVALIALGTVFLRINGLEQSVPWAIGAAGLSVVLLGAASAVRSRIGDDLQSPALAAYAIGVLAALSLGATLVLEREWLTVSLALMVPGIAWVYSQIPVPILRKLAMLFGVAVLLRLFANPFILEYEIVKPLIFNWLLYGYGVPAAAFYWAARVLRRDSNDRTVTLLEAGALVFSVVCVTAQVRLFIHDGDLRSGAYLLSEASLNTIIWASFAYGLFRKAGPAESSVINIGTRVLIYLTLAHIGLVHLLILNPYWSGEAMGRWPGVNILLLAYALPAVVLSAFHLPWHRDKLAGIFGAKNAMLGTGLISVYAFILGLAYITLEVTRAWHGSVLTAGATGDGELYTYSLVWLLYAAILMGFGIWRRNHFVRMAAMMVIALVTGKIFFFDMSNLQGLLRVFSFFGLAVSLLGIGYLYQRYVVVEPKGSDETAA